VGLRRGLVVAQVALSVVLLFGSLLFATSLRNLVTTDPGFNPDGIVTAVLNFNRLDLPVERRAAFQREVLDRLRALPGVQAAATTRIIPVSGSSAGNTVWPEGDRSRQFDPRLNWVGRGYFAALDTPFVAGRDFTDADTLESQPVAIVNDAFASNIAPWGGAVVGRRFTQQATPSGPARTFEIVGIVRNATYADLKEGVIPVAFLSDAQRNPGSYMQVVIRSALPSGTITPAVTRVLADIDPRIGVAYGVLSTAIRDTVGRERLLATLSGGFGVLAAILTLAGLYGLIAYTVTRRTNEIGIRMALGAGRGAIARLILRETSVLLAIGAALGVVLALAGGRAASTLLFGVRPYDPLALLLSLAALAAIAFIASYAPARRAMKIEPVTALRAD
jgi:predicted permease